MIKKLTMRRDKKMKAGAKREQNRTFLTNVMDQHLTHLGGLITFKQPFNNQE